VSLEISGTVVVSRKGASRVTRGHPWVYKSDVVREPTSGPGLVTVEAEGGRFLGVALHSPASLITVRLVSYEKPPLPDGWVRERLRAALARREATLPAGTTAYRWCHGESDLLPSVFVDRYGDVVATQSLSAGGDLLEPEVLAAVQELAAPRAIVVRNDAISRGREGLPSRIEVVHGTSPVVARYREGELELEADLLADQKTGSFLDQAFNHVAAARYARGEALDCFTYHGGFALQLARVCTKVTAVDLSAAALGRAKANAERAGLTNVEWLEADVLELLPALLREGRRFDTVVLDPPAFASNRASEEKALRAYKEINQRAIKLVKRGGVLVSCSCSGRVSPEAFDELLTEAAREARRPVQLLERRGAGPDHPVLLGVPETEYLKCRILAVP
jgi:23S rRNA (cytosine1962-C5)-methyltransferase